MTVFRLIAVLLALTVIGLAGPLCGSAEAYVRSGSTVMPGGHHRLRAVAGAAEGTGSAVTAAYSMRKVRSGYAGPAIRLRRASDNLELDINFLGWTGFTGAPLDVAAATAHCAATSCFVRTWYDQSGNLRHEQQATAGSQPAFIFGCQGGNPCARTTVLGQGMASAAFTPSAVLSLNGVGKQVRSTHTCQYIAAGSNTINMHDSLDIPYLYNGTASINGSGAAGAWHVHTGVMNGAASVLRIDDVADVGGTLAGATTAGTILFGHLGASGGSCDYGELAVWDNYALTAAERANLTANQKVYWGF